jgi:hypothetical protein
MALDRIVAVLYIIDILYYKVNDDSWGIGKTNINLSRNMNNSVLNKGSSQFSGYSATVTICAVAPVWRRMQAL